MWRQLSPPAALTGRDDSGEWNHLAVTDSGIGIPKEDLPHVFERFHRGSNVDDRQFVGMGLGLYICRGIVEQHGGHIWVESPASPLTMDAGASAANESSTQHAWAATGLSTNGSGENINLKDTNVNAANTGRGSTFHVLLPAIQTTLARQSTPVGGIEEKPGRDRAF
jgi:signal transduction histidine kinase